MLKTFHRVNYESLNPKQQENYNFHRISAVLAEYGFVSFRLSNDWLGADFIAHHNDGDTFIKVQLKGRFSLAQKYIDKNIYIAFPNNEEWYLFPHDKILSEYSEVSNFTNTVAWLADNQAHSKRQIPKALKPFLEQYKIFPLLDSIVL